MPFQQPRVLDDAPRDTWLLASAVLTAEARQEGVPDAVVAVPVGGRYPHIHGITVMAEHTLSRQDDVPVWQRDCAHPACVKAYAEYLRLRGAGR